MDKPGYVVRTEFEKGAICTAVVFDGSMVLHAYRLENSDRDVWYGDKRGTAEASVKLAYGKQLVGGRKKTARQVWEEMLPYLERIPSQP